MVPLAVFLLRVCRQHALAVGGIEESRQQRRRLVVAVTGRAALALRNDGVDRLPLRRRDDGLVLAFENLALVRDLTQVQAIAQQLEQVLLINDPTVVKLSGLGLPGAYFAAS